MSNSEPAAALPEPVKPLMATVLICAAVFAHFENHAYSMTLPGLGKKIRLAAKPPADFTAALAPYNL